MLMVLFVVNGLSENFILYIISGTLYQGLYQLYPYDMVCQSYDIANMTALLEESDFERSNTSHNSMMKSSNGNTGSCYLGVMNQVQLVVTYMYCHCIP